MTHRKSLQIPMKQNRGEVSRGMKKRKGREKLPQRQVPLALGDLRSSIGKPWVGLLFSKLWVSEVSEAAQSCPTLCDPVDCSPPGSSIHGILQARIMEWVAISFSRGSSWSRDRTQVSCIAGRRFNLWATREAKIMGCLLYKCQALCLVPGTEVWTRHNPSPQNHV